MSECKILTENIYHVVYKTLNDEYSDSDDEDTLGNLLDYLSYYPFKALTSVCHLMNVESCTSISDVDFHGFPYTVFVTRIA
jgi:hypothetical protein